MSLASTALPKRLLDTRADVETPEGVQLTLAPAGPVVRVLAYSLDILFRTTILAIAAIALGLLGEFGIGVMAILAFLLEWFYPVLFEMLASGATPGKRLFGLRVVQDDGTPVTWQASVLRNLLRVADFLPVGYVAGLVSMAVSRRFQRLGDLAAGTVVVYRNRSIAPAEPAVEGVRPVPVALEDSERQALLAFAERRDTLSEARRQELAGILAPVLALDGEVAVVELEKMASSLLGER